MTIATNNHSATEQLDQVRQRILTSIAGNERGKWTIKIRTLMEMFGYTAYQRVRQSSLVTVENTLADRGIVYSYSGGYTPDDRITLSRPAREQSPPPAVAPGRQSPAVREFAYLNAAPLSLLFHVGDTRNDERSRANASDLLSAVWACH